MDAGAAAHPEEEQAGQERNYERRANQERTLQKENEFNERRAAWHEAQGIDEQVDSDDIAQIIAMWTGIPVSRMQEAETARLLHMEGSAAQARDWPGRSHRSGSGCNSPCALGLKDPRPLLGALSFSVQRSW